MCLLLMLLLCSKVGKLALCVQKQKTIEIGFSFVESVPIDIDVDSCDCYDINYAYQ